MTLQVASILAQTAIEQTFTVVAKSVFCSIAYDPIRCELQTLITKLAIPRFGKFSAPFVGKSFSMIFSFPVTQIYAEVYFYLFHKTIQAIVHVWNLHFNETNIDQQNGVSSSIKEVSIRIIAFTVGFFTSIYITNYGMPFIRTGLEISVEKILPLLDAPIGSSFIARHVILIVAPSLTFFLSDVAGSFTNLATYNILSHTWDVIETISTRIT